eukprot:GGOE01045668.1.p2 GENE.GGOE01045668.1~~GGOE01045668.1.p2  ORF type:complete len:146 (-),score=47.12 GGOE01045668.1:319-756(-)
MQQQDENWVRFVVPDQRLASGGLIGFAGYNQTTANVPSISFKMGFSINLSRLQKLGFSNFYNLRHSWGHLVVMPGDNGTLYLWMDQLLPNTEVTSMQVTRDAAIIFGDLAQGFLTDLDSAFSGFSLSSTTAPPPSGTTVPSSGSP